MIGTHDSAAYKIDYSRAFPQKYSWLPRGVSCIRRRIEALTLTQELDITGQLNAGVRALDIRISLLRGEQVFLTNHTFCCGLLDEVMAQVTTFLDSHPDQKVFLFAKPDWENRDSLAGRYDDVMAYFSRWRRPGLEIRYQDDSHGIDIELIWLNVSTVGAFKESYRKLDPMRVKDAGLYAVLTMPDNPGVRTVLMGSLRSSAAQLEPELLPLFIETGMTPRFLFLDFPSSAIFKEAAH